MRRILTKRHALGLTLAILLLSRANSLAATHHSNSDEAYFRGLPVVGLGELVATLLPPHGFEDLKWDYLVSSRMIAWKTRGIENGGGVESWRTGLVRARAGGKEPQILRKRWEELPWSITLSTDGPVKFGPKEITIRPGIMDGKNTCFGAGTRNCTFSPSDVLRSPFLTSGFLCVPGILGGQRVVFVVAAPGKDPSLLVYDVSEGSRGYSTWLEIRPLPDKAKVCTPKEIPPLFSRTRPGDVEGLFQASIPPLTGGPGQ